MIFVGRGALLWRAIGHAVDCGKRVDLVCGDDPTDAERARRFGVEFQTVTDINTVAELLVSSCTDGVVWSINNRMIFRAPVLESDLRVYNIHHGPLPAYRGDPAIGLVFAILHGETQYAATLHEVDAGIDTGGVLDVERYPIEPTDNYRDAMMRGLHACQRLFERGLAPVLEGKITPLPVPAMPGKYYGRRALAELDQFVDHPAFGRATDLGVFAASFPELSHRVAQVARR